MFLWKMVMVINEWLVDHSLLKRMNDLKYFGVWQMIYFSFDDWRSIVELKDCERRTNGFKDEQILTCQSIRNWRLLDSRQSGTCFSGILIQERNFLIITKWNSWKAIKPKNSHKNLIREPRCDSLIAYKTIKLRKAKHKHK